ncbi:MAG: response regulator [Planctomycetota bacterium]
MAQELEVLFVEAIHADAESAVAALRDAGFEPRFERVEDEASFRAAIADGTWHVVLSDVDLGEFGALRALSLLRRTDLRIPFILLTARLSEEAAVQCLELGADNLVLKNNLARLPGAVVSTLDRYRELEEREELLRQLRQAQKMEAVGRLAGGVAHDFNNLLTVIQGYGQILKRRLVPRGECVDEIEQLLGAAERAANLTRQLLAFSRSQALKPQVLDFGESVQGIRKMIDRLLGADLKMEVEIAPDTGYVRADPGQMEQVLMNLAVNARDAMPDGGTLTLRTSAVEIGPGQLPEAPGLRPGMFVKLEVTDTGEGMDAVTRRQIFEPFFTTKKKGTGLGLATVYGIVRQSKGAVRVRSRPGHGTTFEIYLPQVPGEQAKVEMAAPAEEPQGQGTLLLVEDDDAVRGLLVAELEAAGFSVLASSNAEDAWERRGESIDLLVTDVVMPGMRGPELAEKMREARPGLRVLFVSGYQDPDRTRLPPLDDRTAFLQKPFDPAELVAKVTELLG